MSAAFAAVVDAAMMVAETGELAAGGLLAEAKATLKLQR